MTSGSSDPGKDQPADTTEITAATLPPRRTVLKGAVVGVAAALTAEAAFGHRHPLPIAAAAGPKPKDWRALAASLRGDVLRSGDPHFTAASRVFNTRFDAIAPLAVVKANNPHDVREAIRFARKFELACRAKAGGHSYVGASTRRGALVIDVGRMDRTRYEVGSEVASVGAGATLYSVHAALADHGRTIPTGTCPTVGAAGLTLGGGLGVASRESGLTCDQMVSLTLVTADGQVREVTRHHYPGLFWAHRGGGGGNFGVVTSIQYATQEASSTGFFLLTFPWGHAARVLRGWAQRSREMKRSAWSNLHLEAGTDGSTRVRVVGTCRAGQEDRQAALLEAAVGVDASSVSTFERSFLDGVVFLGGGTTSPRQAFAAGSDVIATMTRDLSTTLPAVVEHRARHRRAAAVILDPLTGAVSDVKAAHSAFPWRNHLCDIQWYVSLPTHPTRGAVSSAYDWIDHAHRSVASHSVGGYVNYLEPRRHVKSYYGANYPRLRQLKREWDPTDFFTSSYSIG